MKEAKALYRRMVDIHASHAKVKATLDAFPKRDKKDIPQNAPERKLRHMCERYESEIGKTALEYMDAVKADMLSKVTFLKAA